MGGMIKISERVEGSPAADTDIGDGEQASQNDFR
jgi:hypothetical protein